MKRKLIKSLKAILWLELFFALVMPVASPIVALFTGSMELSIHRLWKDWVTIVCIIYPAFVILLFTIGILRGVTESDETLDRMIENGKYYVRGALYVYGKVLNLFSMLAMVLIGLFAVVAPSLFFLVVIVESVRSNDWKWVVGGTLGVMISIFGPGYILVGSVRELWEYLRHLCGRKEN